MNQTADSELDTLKQSEAALTKDTQEFISEYDKPLIVENGYIVQGVYWINADFVENFWAHARKKPRPNKCICPHCGSKHSLKGGKP